MRESLAIIERVRRISDGWQHVSLAVEDNALEQLRPGQSLLVRREDRFDPYLRQLWIPVDYDARAGVLEIERRENEWLDPGDVVSVIGPVGAAFPLEDPTRNLLLVVQDYPLTRLRYLLVAALRRGVSVTLVAAGMLTAYPVNSLPPETEIIYSDNPQQWPSFKATVLWADQIFVLTDVYQAHDRFTHLLRAMRDIRHALPENFLYGVFDYPLPCGTGSCMACLVSHHAACVDGPAFDLGKVRF
jgi:NAD(P)H-flavin reductase